MNLSATTILCGLVLAPAWYLVHRKPPSGCLCRREPAAPGLHQLSAAAPLCVIVRGRRQTIAESLFPGYLFIHLTADSSWGPLSSTLGVSRLVGFGGMPLRLNNSLITHLQQRTATAKPAFEAGDGVRIIDGSFAEMGAVFVTMDGAQRVILLLNMLNCQQQISVQLLSINKN